MKNQGEIISLIVFVVLTLALGVTTYFGFKGLGEQKAELATAQSECQNVQNENYTLSNELAAVKERLGFDPAFKGSEIVEAMTADVESALGAQGANKTYKDAVADLRKNIAALDKQISELAADRDAKIRDANASIDQAQDQQTKFVSNVADARTNQNASLETARDDYDKLTKSFVDQTKRFDAVNSQARDAVLEANAETAQNRATANRYADINIDLSRRIDELSNPSFERADGSVVYADQVSKMIRLDIGLDDGVRPLMAFTVYPPEIFDEGGVGSKGRVQVIRTLDAHSCEAKILEDESTAPIQPGDLVYTSFWKPGEFENYALSCRLDVNGDNLSDLNELINLIEANGFKVAAYVDDSGKVHGKITPDVTRVIVPNAPLSSLLSTDAELNDEQRQAIVDSDAQFLADAKANGVREMLLADFLVRMDYKSTDQVVRNAKASSKKDSYGVGVASEPTAPVFNSQIVAPGVNSPGVLVETSPETDAAAEAGSGSADQYFRKRAPNL